MTGTLGKAYIQHSRAGCFRADATPEFGRQSGIASIRLVADQIPIRSASAVSAAAAPVRMRTSTIRDTEV
ncbi:MAG TPA: hypothetical protein PKD43_17775, partial [Nitrospira sp.]|nr:hypothetical protein [Nitrospira sp.]HNI20639.1 hypothetical protein [Nitrospira sp.]